MTTQGITTIDQIVAQIGTYAPDADVGPVMNAYLLAVKAHHGQMRKDGTNYVTHPIAVAGILAEMRMDVDTIATALLHDALEDNPITKAELEQQMGPTITELVDGVTKIGKLKFRSKEELQAENFRKMMLAMSKDLRVILVKLADRLHNMRTLEGHKPEKRRLIARETMDIFAPIANRLGLSHVKGELEALCFRFLEPEAYQRVTDFLERTQSDRGEYIQEVVRELAADLKAKGVSADVQGRAKAPWSIFKKMDKLGVDVEDLRDLLAFRVLVDDLGSCYAVLGFIHARFEPVPGRIKDYIARPKRNGYQSLHTTVVGPRDRLVEVQVRTHEMHRVAENGIAAHWKYKEGHLALDPHDVVEISRIREAFDAAQDAEDASEFMETVKVAFYADEVFVFTPHGDVKRFPAGSTPLDFAYSVHSDVGDHCVGARVNGRMVSLEHAMQTGDVIEIQTDPRQRPRRDWLEIARTSRAISKIRRYLRQQEADRAIKVGKDLLQSELDRLGWTLNRTRSDGRLGAYLTRRNLQDLDPVYGELARGTLSASDVAKAILPEGGWVSRDQDALTRRISTLLDRIGVRRSRSPVRITGEDGLLVHYAGCCGPLPGEEVVGFITRGRGITVHRTDCKELTQLDEDRLVEVRWDLDHGSRHSGTLTIHVDNRPGVLASITRVCEQLHVNIERIGAHSHHKTTKDGVVDLHVAVRDLSELTRVVRGLERLPAVRYVERAGGAGRGAEAAGREA